jgi:LysM repeat protein
VVVLVGVLAAAGGVATALFVVPRATGALRAVTASSVYAEPDEAEAWAGPEDGAVPGPAPRQGGDAAEPEIAVGEAAREPVDPEHERAQAPALPAPGKARKPVTNPPIVLDDVEIEVVEGARPWVIHRLAPGETLAQVAFRHDVTPEALRTWNGLPVDGTLEPGARLKVEARRVPPPREQVRYVVQPGDSWWSIATAHAIDRRDLRAANPTAPARLTVGDSLVLWIDPALYHWVRTDRPVDDDPRMGVRRGAVGIGAPWDGRLVNGVKIPAGEGFRLQQPAAAYGTTHAVASLVGALQAYSPATQHGRPLLVGAMSLRHGGPLHGYRSHQTGRDVDIRLPLTVEHPAWFPIKPWRVDYEALWELVAALADTGEIEVVYLDYELHKALHKVATQRGVGEDARHRLIQWPRGRADDSGLVRHADGHTTHVHVRFRCGRHETECVSGPEPPPASAP